MAASVVSWGIAGCGWVARDYAGPAIEASCNGRIAAVYENHVRLIPLQARYRTQQHIGVVFLRSRERDPNLLALAAVCRMLRNDRQSAAAGIGVAA